MEVWSPHSVYNKLPHVSQLYAYGQIKLSKEQQESLDDIIGVALLHRHFILEENECVVTKVGPEEWKTYVVRYDPFIHKPWHWKFEEGQLLPYEFVENSQDLVSSDQLANICKVFSKFDQNVFAVAVDLQELFFQGYERCSVIETTDEIERTQLHKLHKGDYQPQSDDLLTRFFKKTYEWCAVCSHSCTRHQVCNGHKTK